MKRHGRYRHHRSASKRAIFTTASPCHAKCTHWFPTHTNSPKLPLPFHGFAGRAAEEARGGGFATFPAVVRRSAGDYEMTISPADMFSARARWRGGRGHEACGRWRRARLSTGLIASTHYRLPACCRHDAGVMRFLRMTLRDEMQRHSAPARCVSSLP